MTSKKHSAKTWYAFSLAWQLGFLITLPIGGFLFLGFALDGFLGTTPLFIVAGLLVGIVVDIYTVYHLLSPLMEHEEHHD
ncbi:AtpZ/AtpI family protein [Candidatus Woesebacteria bacterium]|nr:AtpZ/AtpI family protein [Candidatus Woesebacteria bacterium]